MESKLVSLYSKRATNTLKFKERVNLMPVFRRTS